MKRKPVFITIDDINRMFADYLHETGYPKFGEVEKLFLNPAEHKLMFQVSSEEITDPKTEVIKFQLRRTHLV